MDNQDTMDWFNKGNDFYNSGNFEEAVKCYAESTRLNPDDAAAFYNWGNALYTLAKLKQDESLFIECFAKYAASTRLNPDFAAAFHNWGLALYNLAKLKQDESLYIECFANYAASTRLNPDDAAAFYNLGIALYNLAELKQDESLYIECFAKYAASTRLNPDFADAFYNWGVMLYALAQLKQKKSLLMESINKFSDAIEIKPEDADYYYNRSLSYSKLEINQEELADKNAYLYWSIKQKKIKHIQTLLNDFDYYYPLNILAIFEEFQIEQPYLAKIESTISKISDFTNLKNIKYLSDDTAIDLAEIPNILYTPDLLNYFENCSGLNNRELLSIKSLLFYYLGGPVASFMIFDDALDNVVFVLTSQELYYHVKTAIAINNMDAQSILQSAIGKFETQKKNPTDYYYLGHLYLLAGNNDNAINCFKQSTNFFAEIMHLFLEEKDVADQSIVNTLQSLNLQGEIKSESKNEDIFQLKDLAQFQDFFHVSECQEALSQLNILLQPFEPLFWNAFYLSENAKYNIDNQLRKFIIEKTKKEIYDNWDSFIKQNPQENILAIKEALCEYIKDQYYEDKKDDKVNKEFEKIWEDASRKALNAKNINSYEYVLYLSMKNPTLNARDYLSFILYFFLDAKINTAEAFHLLFYLRCKMADVFQKYATNLIIQGVKFFPSVDNISNIVKLGYEYYFTKNLYNKNQVSPHEFINDIMSQSPEYSQFKNDCWRLILMEYNALGDKNFKEQYKLS